MPIEIKHAPATVADEPRSVWRAMARGARGRCPNCGQGKLFRAYVKVADECPACAEQLHHHQADDAPPYFTIFIAGHVIVPVMLWVETAFRPPLWAHMAMFLPATALLCLWLLPITKGAVVGLQWALRMHGFGEPEQEAGADRATVFTAFRDGAEQARRDA
ncbi:MAG: DUF983 domain-containing protein [Hyphomicrobiales bacterium]|nr:DUF983 domain-containing protein [Hyphomicrobiales bacterium]